MNTVLACSQVVLFGVQMGGGGGVSEETQELLARVAELQKEKWALEEKVSR